MSDVACLPAALDYAKRGWRILALSPGSKIPIKETLLQPNGSLSATTDPEHIRKLWELYPLANVGVATGKESNLTVVDFDGPEAQQALTAAGVHVPKTRVVKTRKGYHIYLAYDPELKQGARLMPSLDVRNDGGYVVAPPSVVDGIGYTVFKDNPLGEWPDLTAAIAKALAEKRHTNQTSGVQHPGWVSELLASGAPEGQRNDAASRLAGYFRSINIPQDIAFASLLGFARACQPPMAEGELQAIVTSVWRYSPSKPSTYQGQTLPKPLMDVSSETRRRFMWPESGIEGRLDHLRIRDDGVHCWITLFESGTEVYGPVKLNLLSESGRDQVRRALKERKEHNWQVVLDHIARMTVASFETASARIDVGTFQPKRTQPWLIYPFVRFSQPSVIYADGGTGKSTIALALCVSLATGTPILPGLKVETPFPVYYADWESDQDDTTEVAQLLARGAGLTIPAGMFTYRRFSGPLPEHTDTILADMSELGARFLVVDSAIAAAGEDAHGPDAPRMHYNALRQIGEASLTLTHVPSQSDRMYGNVMWRNLSRVAYLMQSEQEEGASTATLALYNRKGNRGMVPRPIGMKITFENEFIRYESAVVADSPALAEHLTIAERITHCLKSGAASTEDVAEETGINLDTVRRTLSQKRYAGKLWQRLKTGQWGLIEVSGRVRDASADTDSSYRRERVRPAGRPSDDEKKEEDPEW